ncbi:hypothetical protein SLE2022_329420 [Rubroshorea leprosula]
MEMEMRAGQDIELGQDITPPLVPLSFSLYDSFLSSHCSSCFSPLPPSPSPSPSPLTPHLPHYCSPACSSHDSHLHLSTAHPLSSDCPDYADLRTALRLLHFATSASSRCYDRVLGLLTNRDKLMSSPEFACKITNGARVIAASRRLRDVGVGETSDLSLEEAVLCLVITNSVEVQDSGGRSLGIAVYGPGFSWINHSCSPNACYRFLILPPNALSPPGDSKLKMVPGVAGNQELQGESGVCSSSGYIQGNGGYGPRLIVRSIKRIKQGKDVTVSYTDLLQPKAMRQSDLWSKYQFLCSCRRCAASPPAYVDRALEEISASKMEISNLSSAENIDRDKITRKLTNYMDETITEYLSEGDPESCCEKLENVLNLGLPIEELNFKLHPLHHLALNSYTTLASAYKVRSSDLLALILETDKHHMEAFDMSRASAAYSLLLAGATHHLFCSESSLIASAANYWASAGDSLITLAKSSSGNLFVKSRLPISALSKHKCFKCSLIDIFDANLVLRQGKSTDFENVSSKFLDCIADMSPKIWGFLVHGIHHLEIFQDPIDFSWVGNISGFETHIDIDDDSNLMTKESNCRRDEAQEYTNQGRLILYQLGVHCLLYAAFLADICYGQNSYLASHILNILCDVH